jgi:hypothetical protein
MLFHITVTKINEVRTFDTDKMEANGVAYAIENGLKQSLADCHANLKRDDFDSEEEWLDAVREAVDGREASINTGTMRRGGAPDPLLVAAAKAGVSRESLLAFIESQAAQGRAA